MYIRPLKYILQYIILDFQKIFLGVIIPVTHIRTISIRLSKQTDKGNQHQVVSNIMHCAVAMCEGNTAHTIDYPPPPKHTHLSPIPNVPISNHRPANVTGGLN